tara:strand:- start:390 stop:542 length:153 start_codon:yes stop_codon:yes gene_type:complete
MQQKELIKLIAHSVETINKFENQISLIKKQIQFEQSILDKLKFQQKRKLF